MEKEEGSLEPKPSNSSTGLFQELVAQKEKQNQAPPT